MQVRLERAHAGAVALETVAAGEPLGGECVGQQRLVGQHPVGRLVPDQRHRLQRLQFGLGVEQHGLVVVHAFHGLLHHHAVHPHPAPGDVVFSVAARARQLRRQAFGQALGFGLAGLRHAGLQLLLLHLRV